MVRIFYSTPRAVACQRRFPLTKRHRLSERGQALQGSRAEARSSGQLFTRHDRATPRACGTHAILRRPDLHARSAHLQARSSCLRAQTFTPRIRKGSDRVLGIRELGCGRRQMVRLSDVLGQSTGGSFPTSSVRSTGADQRWRIFRTSKTPGEAGFGLLTAQRRRAQHAP
jgi:hypothetical protein